MNRMTTTGMFLVSIAALGLVGCQQVSEQLAALQGNAATSAEPVAVPVPTAEPAPTVAPSAEATVAPTAEASAEAPASGAPSEVATYPNMVTEAGQTLRVLTTMKAYQAAANTSATVTEIPVGTLIKVKASLADWKLVDWPSGVEQYKPGWVELKVNDPRVQAVATTTPAATSTATTTTTSTTTTSSTSTTSVTAAPTTTATTAPTVTTTTTTTTAPTATTTTTSTRKRPIIRLPIKTGQ